MRVVSKADEPVWRGTDEDARAIEPLVRFVLQQTTSPVDSWAVAATLESRGLRDVDAQQRYGERDIFALAERVYAECRRRLAADSPPPPSGGRPLRERVARALGTYRRGFAAGLPMLIQTLAVLALAVALYASLGYDAGQASVVAVATQLSLVVTGGFVQCIGRVTTYHLEQKSFRLAERLSWRLVRQGCATAAGVGVLVVSVNAATGWFPADSAAVGALYYALLIALWLLLAVLYALRLRRAIVLVFLVGAAVAFVLRLTTDVPLPVAHWLGLVSADSTAAAWVWRSLRRPADPLPRDTAPGTPGQLVQAYGLAPYFAYGMAYFALLAVDRMLAWSVQENPLPLWFDPSYELGLNLALVVLVLMLPQLEYTVHAFSTSIAPAQKAFPATDVASHNRRHVLFYCRQLALLGAVAVAATGGVAALVARLQPESWVAGVSGDVSRAVFLWATLGYALLVLALLNGVFLFSLSRPWPVVAALLLALVVDVGVGWTLSRYGDYWWSVGGLVAGAAVFAAVTTVGTLRVLWRFDYYYYSAY